MKRIVTFLVVAMLAVVFAACGANGTKETASKESEQKEKVEEINITHKLGETQVKKNPETVVVFDFGTLDSLGALDIEVAALPKNNIPTYLSEYEDDKYANVGSLKEPDFEKINELQPDLIIISDRQAELYDEFAAIAPTIHLGVDPAKYMESFTDNVGKIGEIFEKETEVEKALATINEDTEKLNKKAADTEENALIVLANDGKVSAYGPNSRFGIIHDVFGFAPADENIEVSTHGQSISFEYIVEKDPNYLFVIDRGAVVDGESSAKQVVENDLVMKTKAAKDEKIVYLDPNYWYLSGGGLVSVSEMVKEIDKSIQ